MPCDNEEHHYLAETNAGLLSQLKRLEARELAAARRRNVAFDWVFRVICGRDVRRSLEENLRSLYNRQVPAPEQAADLIAAVFRRLVRVGFVTILLAVTPMWFNAIQAIAARDTAHIEQTRLEIDEGLQKLRAAYDRTRASFHRPDAVVKFGKVSDLLTSSISDLGNIVRRGGSSEAIQHAQELIEQYAVIKRELAGLVLPMEQLEAALRDVDTILGRH